MRENTRLLDLLRKRFSDAPDTVAVNDPNGVLEGIAGRGSCREFTGEPVPLDVLRTLACVALASPSKSDLQQRDIILVDDRDLVRKVLDLAGDQPWLRDVPGLVVFCANNHRQRRLQEKWKRPFANDHLDAFFNASVDAGIALSAFVIAAEATGLGCCPISTVRNRIEEVSGLLALPDHVFPIAGLAVGYPAAHSPKFSMRLPLAVTVHRNGYSDDGLDQAVAAYDIDRAAREPAGAPRFAAEFGSPDVYTWSDDKTRQYSRPERAGFGAFIRKIGFRLD